VRAGRWHVALRFGDCIARFLIAANASKGLKLGESIVLLPFQFRRSHLIPILVFGRRRDRQPAVGTCWSVDLGGSAGLGRRHLPRTDLQMSKSLLQPPHPPGQSVTLSNHHRPACLSNCLDRNAFSPPPSHQASNMSAAHRPNSPRAGSVARPCRAASQAYGLCCYCHRNRLQCYRAVLLPR